MIDTDQTDLNPSHVPTRRAPDENSHTPFDWDAVLLALDGDQESAKDAFIGAVAIALRHVIQWMIDGRRVANPDDRIPAIGRRTLALAWLLCPNALDGEAKSIRALCQDYKISKSDFSRLAIEAEFAISFRRKHRKKQQTPATTPEQSQAVSTLADETNAPTVKPGGKAGT